MASAKTTKHPAGVRVFTQWRPNRIAWQQGPTCEGATLNLYVCAYWRKGGKQVGCSYSAGRHGIEGAVRRALKRARAANPALRATVQETMATLSW